MIVVIGVNDGYHKSEETGAAVTIGAPFTFSIGREMGLYFREKFRTEVILRRSSGFSEKSSDYCTR